MIADVISTERSEWRNLVKPLYEKQFAGWNPSRQTVSDMSVVALFDKNHFCSCNCQVCDDDIGRIVLTAVLHDHHYLVIVKVERT